MDYLFSVAKRSDTPEILRLYCSLADTSSCRIWSDGCPDRDTVEGDIDAESLYIMTDKKYRIVAVVAATMQADACRFARLGVLPEYQGKGIDDMLLRKAASACRRKEGGKR